MRLQKVLISTLTIVVSIMVFYPVQTASSKKMNTLKVAKLFAKGLLVLGVGIGYGKKGISFPVTLPLTVNLP